MITFLNKFSTEEAFQSKEKELIKQDHYVAYTLDNELVHVKTPFKGIIFTLNGNTDKQLAVRTENENDYSYISLENGDNYISNDDIKYGFAVGESGGELGSIISSLDISSYDSSLVSNCKAMFSGCTNITYLDFSRFDTSKVTDMSYMFGGDDYGCNVYSLDLSTFDTSNITDMNRMFSNCKSLTSLDLSSFDASNVTNMNRMFYSCYKLTSIDLSSFNTSNVTDMSEMFSSCSELTSLDLSNFDTSKITEMYWMFENCNSLTRIKCKQTFKNWCITNQNTISLPTEMRDGGSGQWEIVG